MRTSLKNAITNRQRNDLKNVVHGCMEGGWGILQPEGHHNEFIMAVGGSKSSFVDIVSIHSNLMVTNPKI